jgi:hypothetical protein
VPYWEKPLEMLIVCKVVKGGRPRLGAIRGAGTVREAFDLWFTQSALLALLEPVLEMELSNSQASSHTCSFLPGRKVLWRPGFGSQKVSEHPCMATLANVCHLSFQRVHALQICGRDC